MPVVLSELKNELLTDVNGYGYASYIASGDMQTLAEMLNQIRSGELSVNRSLVTREEIFICWDLAEIQASYNHVDGTGPARLILACFLMEAPYQLTDEVTRQGDSYNFYDPVLRAFQNAGNVTYDATVAMVTRPASRGEDLWGAGTEIWWFQCYNALQLP